MPINIFLVPVFRTIYFYYQYDNGNDEKETFFSAIQWRSREFSGAGRGKRDSESKSKSFVMMLVQMKGRKRKLPEIICKHIFMKFYDFLNRKYSLWLCAQFSLLLHIIIDVKRFSFIAVVLLLLRLLSPLYVAFLTFAHSIPYSFAFEQFVFE